MGRLPKIRRIPHTGAGFETELLQDYPVDRQQGLLTGPRRSPSVIGYVEVQPCKFSDAAVKATTSDDGSGF
jgi:hypothetical protein